MNPYASVYVFVRTDIPLEQQMVQALHAVYGMAALWVPQEHTGKDAANIVLLGLPSVAALRRALAKLQTSGLGHYSWVEPDGALAGQLTALCTVPLREPERAVLKNYKLWSLREQAGTIVMPGPRVKSLDPTSPPVRQGQSGSVVRDRGNKSASGECDTSSDTEEPLNTGVAQHTEHSVLTERLEAQTLPPVPSSHEQQSRCCE